MWILDSLQESANPHWNYFFGFLIIYEKTTGSDCHPCLEPKWICFDGLSHKHSTLFVEKHSVCTNYSLIYINLHSYMLEVDIYIMFKSIHGIMYLILWSKNSLLAVKLLYNLKSPSVNLLGLSFCLLLTWQDYSLLFQCKFLRRYNLN